MADRLRARAAVMAARLARRLTERTGTVADLGGAWSVPRDCDPQTAATIRRVGSYTLTPPARLMALCEAVRHVVRSGIDGAIVECGVWRGGSMMAVAHTLLELGVTDRELYLYDTFTEMPPLGEHDALSSGEDLATIAATLGNDPVYRIWPEDRVREHLDSTGYPMEKMRFVKGLVEDTIPAVAPDTIALCRLDTDYYESTRHELEQLYPRISTGGVLIIDDYGEFVGARKAVDEYFEGRGDVPLLHRVDFSCREMVVR